MKMQLLPNVGVREVLAPVAAGSSIDSNSDIIDMQGYEGVVFVVPITDSVATGVATLTVEQNSANSGTGMSAITGATATVTCAVNDDVNNTLLIVDVHKPQERYVQGVVTSATANIAYGNMMAILYGPRKLPVSDHASVSDSAAVAPAA